MGLGSGIQQVKDVHFKSPVSGGDRIAGIGYSWSGGGQMPDNEKLAMWWIYAFSDELTADVIQHLSQQLDLLAAETGREILRYPQASDGFDLAEMQAKISAGTERPYWYLGYGPLADRIVE